MKLNNDGTLNANTVCCVSASLLIYHKQQYENKNYYTVSQKNDTDVAHYN